MNVRVIINRTFKHYLFLQMNNADGTTTYFVNGKEVTMDDGNALYINLKNQFGFTRIDRINNSDEAEALRLRYLDSIDPYWEYIESYKQMMAAKQANADAQTCADTLALVYDLPDENHISVHIGDQVHVITDSINNWCKVCDMINDNIVVSYTNKSDETITVSRDDIKAIRRPSKFDPQKSIFDNTI